jgi:hypothetical protein
MQMHQRQATGAYSFNSGDYDDIAQRQLALLVLCCCSNTQLQRPVKFGSCLQPQTHPPAPAEAACGSKGSEGLRSSVATSAKVAVKPNAQLQFLFHFQLSAAGATAISEADPTTILQPLPPPAPATTAKLQLRQHQRQRYHPQRYRLQPI